MNHVSIVVGKNRSSNLDYSFDNESPDVVLLDDGHQHLKMERDLNIVLFDAMMPARGNTRLHLWGICEKTSMRSKMQTLSLSARSIKSPLNNWSNLKQLIRKHCLPDVIVAQIIYKPLGIHSLQQEEHFDVSKFKGKNVICVAGIASTSGFYNMIESLGINVVKKYSFPDHYFFNNNEIEILLKEAEESNCHIIMTEKDAVKVHRFFHDRIYYLKIGIEFVNGEESVQETIARVI